MLAEGDVECSVGFGGDGLGLGDDGEEWGADFVRGADGFLAEFTEFTVGGVVGEDGVEFSDLLEAFLGEFGG